MSFDYIFRDLNRKIISDFLSGFDYNLLYFMKISQISEKLSFLPHI